MVKKCACADCKVKPRLASRTAAQRLAGQPDANRQLRNKYSSPSALVALLVRIQSNDRLTVRR